MTTADNGTIFLAGEGCYSVSNLGWTAWTHRLDKSVFITPRENPRRRSVGLQNEARFNQLCWLNLAEPAPQAGASDFRVGV